MAVGSESMPLRCSNVSTAYPDWIFHGSPQPRQTNAGTVSWSRPQPMPPKTYVLWKYNFWFTPTFFNKPARA
jgi:hypothetical protein